MQSYFDAKALPINCQAKDTGEGGVEESREMTVDKRDEEDDDRMNE